MKRTAQDQYETKTPNGIAALISVSCSDEHWDVSAVAPDSEEARSSGKSRWCLYGPAESIDESVKRSELAVTVLLASIDAIEG